MVGMFYCTGLVFDVTIPGIVYNDVEMWTTDHFESNSRERKIEIIKDYYSTCNCGAKTKLETLSDPDAAPLFYDNLQVRRREQDAP